MHPISAAESSVFPVATDTNFSGGAKPIRVLVVGCGRMGAAHALAYQSLAGFRIVGLVSRKDGSRENLSRRLGDDPALFDEFETALKSTRPDAVSINTHPDTHAAFSVLALRAGAHVFVEKPLALSMHDAESVLATAAETGRKLMVGYILHHHPAFRKLVEWGRTLGSPLAMRMSLNQQSDGGEWETHRRLLETCSPLVDCGVHYVDLMCRLTGARPIRVHAVGARLCEGTGADNYGQLQVVFADGSVGWFESGWGPMIGRTAPRIQDIVGPRGSISLIRESKPDDGGSAGTGERISRILLHRSDLDHGRFSHRDEFWVAPEEPSLADLCLREQEYFLQSIRSDADFSDNHQSARESLRIVLAAQQSRETGEVVRL